MALVLKRVSPVITGVELILSEWNIEYRIRDEVDGVGICPRRVELEILAESLGGLQDHRVICGLADGLEAVVDGYPLIRKLTPSGVDVVCWAPIYNDWWR